MCTSQFEGYILMIKNVCVKKNQENMQTPLTQLITSFHEKNIKKNISPADFVM